jgi:hypothetical protein
MFTPIVDQPEWGSRLIYLDGSLGRFAPRQWVLHWGGGGPYHSATRAEAASLLRKWQAFHIDSRGWRDIAYNYASSAAEDTVAHRLRGENPNGAHTNSALWGPITRAFVFYTGPKGPDRPSDNQLRSFARLWASDPLPVTGHGLLDGQSTQCPGPWLKAWIADEGWLDYLEGNNMAIRLAGARAADTAAKGSKFVFQTATKVYIANRHSAPDVGVAGVVAAQKGDGPVLLVDVDNVPAETKAEIIRLGIKGSDNIVIVGGTAVVSDAVEAALDKLVS